MAHAKYHRRMASSYDEAVTALYQAPHESFVAERQRLSAELKASGDKLTAARVAKLARPPISAWAVNQLWWHARATFDELFETAGELRAGKLAARAAHRKALATLSARARKLLTESGHASSEGTLRRVEMTLSGLAAAGSFDPEPAGALTKDRDPPGFAAFGIEAASDSSSDSDEAGAPTAAEREPKSKAEAPDKHELAETKRREHVEAQRARDEAAAAAAKKREAEARAKREAARHRVQAQVREAKSELTERERARDHIAKELAAAERDVTRAREALEKAEAELTSTDDAE